MLYIAAGSTGPRISDSLSDSISDSISDSASISVTVFEPQSDSGRSDGELEPDLR